MTLVDFIIIISGISAARRWYRYGLSRGAFSLGGFWAGIFIGALFVPVIVRFTNQPLDKLLLSMLVIFGAASIGGWLGRLIGQKLHGFLQRLKLTRLDAIFGAVFSVGMMLVIAWLVAAFLNATPYKSLNKQVRGSAIIRGMNRIMPAPPSVLSRIATLIDPHNLPQVFIGQEPPIQPVNPPSSADVAAAQKAAAKSTVRIESFGCEGELFGSGFVAAPDEVVTNAHVVAGVERPVIVDVGGKHQAQVVYFDPDLDLAILSSHNLAGPPLIASPALQPRGTAAVALGYPGGGPLVGGPASVAQEIRAVGRNIYGRGLVRRSIYVLQVQVEPGNSGGPLVLPDGTVIGVIFGRSETDANVGYAITSDQIIPIIQNLQPNNQAVSTGVCIDD